MSQSAEEVLNVALELAPRDRAEVAARLISSLDETVDEGVEQAWAQEIERRIRAIDEGTARMISWEEARRMIRGEIAGPDGHEAPR
jgi:putative addiction module component (TIGR02574 family)